METVAAGITAPEASVTVPTSVAPVTWAETGTEKQRLSAKATSPPSLEAILFEPFLEVMRPSSESCGIPQRQIPVPCCYSPTSGSRTRASYIGPAFHHSELSLSSEI